MANIKSAKKRVLTNDRQRSENRYVKATMATYVKDFRKMLAEGRFAEAEKKLISTISYIDSARSKGVIHKNNASRKIARLTSAYTQATANVEVKPVEAKVVKKETVKKDEEKPAKKTTTKKTVKKEEK